MCYADDIIIKLLDEIDFFQRRYLEKKEHIDLEKIFENIINIISPDKLQQPGIVVEFRLNSAISKELDSLLEQLFSWEKKLRKRILKLGIKENRSDAQITFFGFVTLPVTKREALMALVGFIVGAIIVLSILLPISL